MSGRRTGLQKRVIAFYRQCLRAAKAKGDAASRAAARQFVQSEFRSRVETVKRTDFQTIELLLKQGEKRLKVYGNPNVSGFSIATPARG